MADLAIKIEYSSKLRRLFLHMMRLTFPIWTLGPLALIFFIKLLPSRSAIPPYTDTAFAQLVEIIVFPIAVIVLCLLTIRTLGKNKLLIDKKGIEMPLDFDTLKGSERYMLWKDIVRKSAAQAENTNDMTRDKLLFFSRATEERSAEKRSIALDRLTPSDLDQLLVSINVFAPQAEQDTSVKALKDDVKQSVRQGQANLIAAADGASYTELWEEELSRRFRAAAFMPLEVGLIMRGGSLTIVRPWPWEDCLLFI